MQRTSSDPQTRTQLAENLSRELGRELGARTILFHQAIAERMGLSLTDHKCLDYITRGEPLTAGQLAELTTLTTGAITGVIDRLERSGYVQREQDPNDRRRVIIRPRWEKLEAFLPMWDAIAARFDEVAARYSDEELAVIGDFITRTIAVLHDITVSLRGQMVQRSGTGRE